MEKLLPLFIVFGAMLGIIGIAVLAATWARRSSRRAAFWGGERNFSALG
jgi:hypothetical protein